MQELEELLIWLSIVPIAMGIIAGLVGPPLAIAHGDWVPAIVCLLVGIGSVGGLYLGQKRLAEIAEEQ